MMSLPNFSRHHPSTALTHFPYPSLVAESQQLHFKPSHQDTWLIIISCLLIIIQGICITLHAFVTSRSLATLLNLVWFCWKILYTNLLHYICLPTTYIHWSSWSEKTFLMSTPKHPEGQIFQIYPGKSDDWSPPVSNSHNSFTLYTALHSIQLYMLSFGVELLDRSVINLLLQKISVNFQVLLLCFWLHIVVVVYYTTTTSTTTRLI